MATRADLLKRRNRGRELAPEIKDRLGAALGRSPETIEFLELQESDALERICRERWRLAKAGQHSGRHFFLETTDSREMQLFACQIQPDLGDEPLYLFLPEAPYCGAVRITTSELLHNVVRLATLDQDDVLACDVAGNKGVACEYFTDWGADGSQMKYRFLAWM